MTNVENLTLLGGHSYDLTTDNATVSAVQQLEVDAHALGVGDSLTFDGSAESNGSFFITGGAGNDVLTGGNYTPGGGDLFDLSLGGADTAYGGDGYDFFRMGGALTAADTIDGGASPAVYTDIVFLDGDYSAGLTFSATTMTNVEALYLGFNSHLGLQLRPDHQRRHGRQRANADGERGLRRYEPASPSTARRKRTAPFTSTAAAGDDTLIGGMGNDIFDLSLGGNNSVTGGAGADDITCGGGTDTLVYTAGSNSTSTGHDTIMASTPTPTNSTPRLPWLACLRDRARSTPAVSTPTWGRRLTTAFRPATPTS